MGIPDNYLVGYPPLITNKEWQKKKKLKDKLGIGKKTGLGAELIKAEAAYKKINFDLLDSRMQGKWADGDAIREGKQRAQQHYNSAVKPAIQVFLRASKKAHTAHKNTALTKTAQTAAAAISRELLRHVTAMQNIKFNDFDETLQRWQEGINRWRQRLNGNVLKLEEQVNALYQDPQLKEWDNELTQAFRSVGNSLGNNPEFRDIWPIWKPWDGLQKRDLVRPNPEDERKALKAHLKQVRRQIAILKNRIGA